MPKIIEVPEHEMFDERTQEFINIPKTTLHLEHSLVSISKWEAKFKKPFISKLPQHAKTQEETLEYIKFMTITQNVNPVVYLGLTPENIKEISDYIEDPMTASFVNDESSKGHNGEQVTSELIYWWMTSLQIPWEAQKWHLNRLMMLIRIGSVKSQPPKKMSQSQILARNRALNEARKKKYNTKG